MKSFTADTTIRRGDEIRAGRFAGEIRAVPEYERGPLRYRCFLRLDLDNGTTLEESGADFFAALISIRRRIEPEGWRVHCLGASLGTWTTAGPRFDMTFFGTWCYRLHHGCQPTPSHHVDTFGVDSTVVPVSVDEQAAYYSEWLESLQREPNRVVSLRLQLGLSQSQMAERLGVSLAEVLGLERGGAVPEELAGPLADLASEAESVASVRQGALKEARWSRPVFPRGSSAFAVLPPLGALVLTVLVLVLTGDRIVLSDPPIWQLTLGFIAFLGLRRILAPRCRDCGATVSARAEQCPRCAVHFLRY